MKCHSCSREVTVKGRSRCKACATSCLISQAKKSAEWRRKDPVLWALCSAVSKVTIRCQSAYDRALRDVPKSLIDEMTARWTGFSHMDPEDMFGRPIDLYSSASIDHIVPRYYNGTDDASNLCWCHVQENYEKGPRMLADYLPILRADRALMRGDKIWLPERQCYMYVDVGQS